MLTSLSAGFMGNDVALTVSTGRWNFEFGRVDGGGIGGSLAAR